jgi:transcriptional regulator with XRE-family HTH domain
MVEKKVSYAAVVGAVLFEERERRNVSQAAAANVAGLTQSTWARMELGRACTLENLAKASEAFRFELWQLLRVVDDRVRGLKEQGT